MMKKFFLLLVASFIFVVMAANVSEATQTTKTMNLPPGTTVVSLVVNGFFAGVDDLMSTFTNNLLLPAIGNVVALKNPVETKGVNEMLMSDCIFGFAQSQNLVEEASPPKTSVSLSNETNWKVSDVFSREGCCLVLKEPMLIVVSSLNLKSNVIHTATVIDASMFNWGHQVLKEPIIVVENQTTTTGLLPGVHEKKFTANNEIT